MAYTYFTYDIMDDEIPCIISDNSIYNKSNQEYSPVGGSNDSYSDNGMRMTRVNTQNEGIDTLSLESSTANSKKATGIYTPYGYDDSITPVVTTGTGTSTTQYIIDSAQDERIAQNASNIENVIIERTQELIQQAQRDDDQSARIQQNAEDIENLRVEATNLDAGTF